MEIHGIQSCRHCHCHTGHCTNDQNDLSQVQGCKSLPQHPQILAQTAKVAGAAQAEAEHHAETGGAQTKYHRKDAENARGLQGVHHRQKSHHQPCDAKAARKNAAHNGKRQIAAPAVLELFVQPEPLGGNGAFRFAGLGAAQIVPHALQRLGDAAQHSGTHIGTQLHHIIGEIHPVPAVVPARPPAGAGLFLLIVLIGMLHGLLLMRLGTARFL